MLMLLLLTIGLAEPQIQTFGAQKPTPAREAVQEKKGTASIRGKVTAADGAKAIRRVQITVSSPELTESRSVSTNSEGAFEVKELPAGRYTISASRAGYLRLSYGQRRPGETGRPIQLADGQKVQGIDFALPRMGVIAGRVTDEIGDPIAGVSVFPMQLRYFRGRKRMVPLAGQARTDDTGQYRLLALEPGDYYVMATTRETWTNETNEKEKVGFGPTYFGGTLNLADAQKVKVGLGQEVSGTDFALVPGRVAAIKGTATTSFGMGIAGESISLSQEFAGPNFTSSFGFAGGKINPDGSFAIKDVPPGEYKLTLRYPGDAEHPAEVAAQTVVVSGPDLEGVSLVTGAGGTLEGRVTTDTGAPLPSGSGRLQVSARPVDLDSNSQRFNQDNGRVRDNGAFEIVDLAGAQRLSIGPLPAGWAVKAIEFDGKDYADVPIDVKNGLKIEGVKIVLSNKMPTLRGTLMDDKAQPASGSVLLFPDDPVKWSEGSRLVRTARPDQSGAFEFRNMPVGEYLIVPLEYLQTGSSDDPEFLQSLRDRATKVSLGEGETKGVNLTLK
jgi:Carboxypeptidase regulatory-like domain